ncbi:LysR family transcriptional regulator [Nocardioides flavescens]|uniref:LysR family transcriptional regulator n=1 Tax=Nocardioides flavescens TaxID=2691959 RepID=A0A6L7EUY4_9ACTN|nr:LysR family transcriptional regulator [Nocardioides flavescens]MXG89496.1 LysR family transcriptional regulator [Nocardioides flavescens]
MEIDPRRLRFLLAIARTGGVLAAADELRVTPSAVSQQVTRLEQETGRTLLQRTPTGSVLTPAGLALAEAAEDVERALILARERLETDVAEVSGTVRVGGFESFFATILAPALPQWRARYPGLRIDTIEAEEDDLLRGLRSGGVDALVVELDAEGSYTPPRGTTDVPLLDEPWKLVVPTGLLFSTEVVDLGRLTLPWLGVDPSAASAQAIERVRRLLDADTSTAHTYYSVRNALALVAAGEGITLIPSLALEAQTTEGVDALDIPGLGMRRIVLRHLSRSRGRNALLETATALVREAAAAFSYEPTG